MRLFLLLFFIPCTLTLVGQTEAEIFSSRQSMLDSISRLNKLGHYDDALALIRRTEQEVSGPAAEDWSATLSGYRGLILLSRGDDAGALSALDGAVDIASEDYRTFLPMFYRLRAKVATTQGRHLDGLKEIEQGLTAYYAEKEDVGELVTLNVTKASCYDRLSREDEAIKLLDETDSIAQARQYTENFSYANLLSKKGDVLMQMREYTAAQDYLDQSNDLYKRLGNCQLELRVNYLRLGNLCLYSGDFTRALGYFKRYQALNYALNRPEGDIGRGYGSIGLAQLFSKKYGVADLNLHRSEKILTGAYGSYHPYVSMMKRYRGQALVGLERYGEALETIRDGLRKAERNPSYDVKQLADDYSMLGRAYGQLARYDSAQHYFAKAEAVLAEALGPENKSSIYARLYSSRLLIEAGNFSAAQNRLASVWPILRYDDQTALENYPMPNRLLLALDTKAAINLGLYEQTGKRENLDVANATYVKAIGVMEFIQRDFLSESSRDYSEIKYGIVENAVKSAYYLHETAPGEGHATQALKVIEAFKARRLRAELNNNLRLRLGEFPMATRRQLDSLRAGIDGIRREIFDNSQQWGEAERALKQGELAGLSAAYDSVRTDLLAQETRGVFSFLTDRNGTENVAATAPPPHQTLLQFFAAEDDLYLVSQTGGQAPHFSKLSGKPWRDLRRLTTRWSSALGSEQAATNTAIIDSISVLLWPLLEEGIDPSARSLLIIPSGALSVFPFGSLATGQGVLLERYAVQYAYSKRLLDLQQTLPDDDFSKPFAAFAPAYDSVWAKRNNFGTGPVTTLVRGGNYQLPGAMREAREFSALLGGDIYQDTAASRRMFLDSAANYGILHLSMHAEHNPSQPDFSRLFFSEGEEDDGILTAAEIRGRELRANLVVLAACETGLGKHVDGEGVLSLSRAFAFAGVPATVHSLWKVPDEQTYELLSGFYLHLKKGEDKVKALRLAKLDFLAGCVPELRLPFYWSGFVLVGDERALYPRPWAWWWWLGLPLLGAGLWAWRRNRG